LASIQYSILHLIYVSHPSFFSDPFRALCTLAQLHAEQAFMERAILLVIIVGSIYTSQHLSIVSLHAYREQVHNPCPAALV
jgi:hypothetical protein